MPTNVTHEYTGAERKYHAARTIEEKLLALQELLRTAPGHKGAEKLRQSLKQRMVKLREQQERQTKKGGKRGIRKEGAATICLIGVTNSGKSWLLHKLTGAQVVVSPYPYTTQEPVVGMWRYLGVYIQVIEIPAITKDFSGAHASMLKQGDVIACLLSEDSEKKIILQILKKYPLSPPLWIRRNTPLEKIQDHLWEALHFLRVFTKLPGKKHEEQPIALPEGSTVLDVAQEIHKDFVDRFLFARVTGKSAKFPRQRVSIEHLLADGDVIEFHLRDF